ncbi:S9 family peptidase [Pullulanibacillus sp. KACC 23026]|uniref:S9 family peptidase n=1 Tax=Pullulanibacillus sp. KACC 23026 TaxID=3028315 RepID=UPI0023B14C55|nr:S9 family peptidase [Pullulanibacillus sp. KACC 23026]WEG12588.1 S9 family peptidase [Pullulanibacillus sp. KACC 23026]
MMSKKVSYLSIEEIVSLPMYTDTSISDDGEYVAYVKQTTDWEENTYPQHVWLYHVKSGNSYPVSAGQNESMSPRFSNDSQTLAYISPVGEGEKKKKQLFIHTCGTTESIQVTHSEQGVDRFKWSPDGKGIYFIAKRPETERMKKRKELYGEFTYVDQDFQFNDLVYVGLESAKRTQSLPKDLKEKDELEAVSPFNITLDVYIHDFDISPTHETIVFTAAPSSRMIDYQESKAYMLDIRTKEVTPLDLTSLLAGTRVLFSPDGSKLCYTRYLEEKAFFNNETLEIYDLHSKETSLPMKSIDENVSPIRWTMAGILISWQNRTNYLAGLVTEEGELTSLVAEEDSVALNSSITNDGKQFVCVKATSEKPLEVYVDGQAITEQYKLYEGKVKSQKEVIHWRTRDGLEIEGILSKPVDYDASKSYPLILAVHGGPAGTSLAIPTMNKYQPVESFVEKGFLVLEPNYRGSAGYGEAFRKANFRKLGLGDYEDVISGVDYLIENRNVDRDKVGILGWSQGGYISAFCATYSNRFKAISVGAGISNWMTYYVNTDITHFTRFYLGSDPWKDEEIYRRTSPMTYINNASTPTLIQHGEVDPRVPVPNAYELYRGLKDVGVETELVIFKGMKHGATKPGINRAILKQNLDWFSHYILGEPRDEKREY